jgi:hypothetical protein
LNKTKTNNEEEYNGTKLGKSKAIPTNATILRIRPSVGGDWMAKLHIQPFAHKRRLDRGGRCHRPLDFVKPLAFRGYQD